MVEQAFKVDRGSTLYKDYFESLAEKQKMHDLARVFFEKHDLMPNMEYYLCTYLALQLTEDQRQLYAPQLKKFVDTNNMSYFKKNSLMYKEWQETVVNKVNLDVIDKLWYWYWPYISKGSYSLWNDGEELYGYLSDEHKDTIELSDYMKPIKMSEYYKVIESRTS